MTEQTHKRRHIQVRIIVFTSMLVLSFGVLVILGSSRSHMALITIGSKFSNFLGRVEEKFYFYQRDFTVGDTQENARTVPVLLYHGIGDDTSKYTLTKSEFRSQMIALKAAGFRTIDADTFMKFMRQEVTLPEKSFLLTFDDGRKDSYYGADPILTELGFHAVMFIAPGQSLSQKKSLYYLNIQEVKNMVASGRWDIGSHAMQDDGGYVALDAKGTEGYLLSNRKWLTDKGRVETTTEYRDRIVYELSESKKAIALLTGKADILFSYPFGDYGADSKDAAVHAQETIRSIISAQYPYAFHQLSRPNNGFSANSPFDNALLLKRIEVRKDISTEKIVTTLESATDLTFKEQTITGDVFRSFFPRWHNVWGTDPELINNEMTISTGLQEPSSLTMFDGTRNWRNYGFSITTKEMPKSNIALYARSSGPQQVGVRCTWSAEGVAIEEADGSEKKISFSSTLLPGTSATLGIAVRDDVVGCYENGALVGAARMFHTTRIGGVGIEVWSGNQAATKATIHSLSFFSPRITADDVAVLQKLATKSLVQEKSLESLEKSLTSFSLPPRYVTHTSLIGSDPALYTQNPFGQVAATFALSPDTFATTVTTMPTNAGAYVVWPSVAVTGGQEYSIEGSYTATVASELKAKFTRANGSVEWVLIKALPITATSHQYQFTVLVPADAVAMNILQSPIAAGTVVVQSPRIYALENGALEKGMVTLVFDDGRKNFITNAMPLLSKYQLPATTAIITSHTGFSGYMTPKDLADAKKAGYEIAAHTRGHVHLDAKVSYENLIKEIVGSWSDLAAVDLMPTTFVYPYGNFSESAKNITSQRFIGARSVERGFNTKNTDPYALKDQLVERTTSQADITNWLATAKNTHTWLVLELHNINTGDVPTDSEGITSTQLDYILSSIKKSGLKVTTLNDGLLVLRAR